MFENVHEADSTLNLLKNLLEILRCFLKTKQGVFETVDSPLGENKERRIIADLLETTCVL